MFPICLTVAINYQKSKSHPERISKIKPFIDQYNWKEINFPSDKEDGKKFELINKSIALNILFAPYNTEEIRLVFKSKYDFKHENQVIVLMITDAKKWHWFAVKSLSALLRGITWSHKGDFYCLTCFHSYSTKNKLEKHEKVCKDPYYCYVEMPNGDNKILKYKHGEKSMKLSFIIYADL